MTAFVGWLQPTPTALFWGTYRCERWGPHEASLHAENRAVDSRLDVGNAAGSPRGSATHRALPGPRRGRYQHCSGAAHGARGDHLDRFYWVLQDGPGADKPCLSKHGAVRRHVDPTIAHRNHIHFGCLVRATAPRTSGPGARLSGARRCTRNDPASLAGMPDTTTLLRSLAGVDVYPMACPRCPCSGWLSRRYSSRSAPSTPPSTWCHPYSHGGPATRATTATTVTAPPHRQGPEGPARRRPRRDQGRPHARTATRAGRRTAASPTCGRPARRYCARSRL